MTDTTDPVPASAGGRKTGLNALLLPELKRLAGGLGIKATGMRKGDLVAAISAAQGGRDTSRSRGTADPGPGGGASGSQQAPSSVGRARAARTKSAAATAAPAAAPEEADRRGTHTPTGQATPAETTSGHSPRRRSDEREQPGADTQPRSDAQPHVTGQGDRADSEQSAGGGPTEGQQGGRQKTRRRRDESTEQVAAPQRESDRTGQSDQARQDDQTRQDDQARQEDQARQDDRTDRGRGHEATRDRSDDNGRAEQDTRSRQGAADGGSRESRTEDHRSQQRGHDNNGAENRPQQGAENRSQQGGADERSNDEDGGSRRNRRRRGRDRVTGSGGQPASEGRNDGRSDSRNDGRNDGRNDSRNDGRGTNRGQRGEPDLQVLDDDVLAPCAGILDLLDNYAFVRTSGYLPGNDDVYVSMSMVRKFGLRRGDAVTGQVRQPREGERKEKYNPLVKLDSVNGADPETSRHRVEFNKLTPLYPSERLRLETVSSNLIGRVIDIAAPIGKGQRGLIVSPSKAGKTMIMQSIANSITTNNPECHLMVVLVDERPEEVTDFERSVKGEVVSSTFDRPAADHTIVAELAIERAKRLVELGHDVVVLLDGITRLGRAYNLAAPASGRILSGGVDSAALYPPKRFFGAARNIEDGGSLTIVATALIESGSKMDEVIFEEFKGTGNMEIRLRRDFADKRIFPAIDAVQSGTRREELLMSKEELAIIWKLRRVLSGLDGQQALELLLERLRKSQNNLEFLMQVQKTTPKPNGQDD